MQHLVVDINVLVNMQHLQKLVNMQQRLLLVNMQELHTSEYATGNIVHCIYKCNYDFYITIFVPMQYSETTKLCANVEFFYNP